MIKSVTVAEHVDGVALDSAPIGAPVGARWFRDGAAGPHTGWANGPLQQNPRSMLHRVTAILSCFVHEWERLSLHDFVERTGLPRSTTHRILDSLVSLKWLTSDAPYYRLGERSLQLASQSRNHIGVRSAANPHLMELHERTGLVVTLDVIDGADSMVVDVIGARSRRECVSRVGDRSTAFAGISGRAILSTMQPEVVDSVLDGHLPSRIGSTVWTRMRLHAELSRIRRRHGVSIEHSRDRSRCTGAGRAVPDPLGASAAVSLHAPSKEPVAWRGVPKWTMPLLVECTRRIAEAESRDRIGWA